MIEMDTNWKTRKLNQLCKIQYGQSPNGIRSDDGKFFIIGTGGIVGKSNHFLYNKPSILIGRKGTIDTPIYLYEPFWAIDTTFFLIINNDLNIKWLYYSLCSKKLMRYNESTGVPSLNRETLYKIKIQVPPLPEQKRIAQILSTWDRAIESLGDLIDAKIRLKKTLMQQLLTGKKRFGEFVNSKNIQQTKYTPLPADWDYKKIGFIAQQSSLKNNKNEKLPVLSCTKYDGLVNSLDYFERQIFSKNTSSYKVVKRGDFAYATNHIEEGSIGYQNLYNEALISPMYTVFRTNNLIEDGFLFRILKTELYRHIFEVNTSSSINRRGSLRWHIFSLIKIPIPSLDEQRKITSVFVSLEKEITILRKQLEQIKAQKKGLMQKLLTGQIRVKIDEEKAYES